MPFTLSHAVAALPGIRRDGRGRGPLLPSALVAGTLAPDAVYFADSLLPGAMRLGQVTHSAWGVVTVDVLAAAGLVAVWLLVRGTVVALLPDRAQLRVWTLLGPGRWRGRPLLPLAGWFAVSAALGALTHVVWDLFTHAGRWGVRTVPFLDGTVAGVPAYSVAQYGSSAVALAVLGPWLLRALRSLPAGGPPASVPRLSTRGRRYAVALLAGAAVVGAVHRCLRWAAVVDVPLTPMDLVPTSLFGAGAGLAVALPVLAAVVHWSQRSGSGEAAGLAGGSARSGGAGTTAAGDRGDGAVAGGRRGG
ncbi:DUF4184 family protein [Streptomyces sp. 549]|uniref:DUF4184 family protein n=1 Tax=Streptomyces sp. 549 TaxID=3049076 RepID=UPI0024C223DA|nr:DUF4184 family protein [Streptomyces sp. 549]MDK1472201.1 DUF4184 family protein [Streptomyces sp. 549]